MKRALYTVVILICVLTQLEGQVEQKIKLIQASGVITNDENKPVYNAAVISRRLKRGTISEISGIYSVISLPGDTIVISALGYKKYTFGIPADFDGRIYKKDVVLISDTISIEGINVFPWKTYEEFKREFLAAKPVIKPEILYMYENLVSIQQSVSNAGDYRVSPEAGFRMAMQQNANATMTRNQNPSNNLLNPFAWAKFFSGLKSGLLRNEKSQQRNKSKASNSRQK
ncbi:MAG: hypothetical protein ACUVTX_09980 [Bacteroidales bacterium]